MLRPPRHEGEASARSFRSITEENVATVGARRSERDVITCDTNLE